LVETAIANVVFNQIREFGKNISLEDRFIEVVHVELNEVSIAVYFIVLWAQCKPGRHRSRY